MPRLAVADRRSSTGSRSTTPGSSAAATSRLPRSRRSTACPASPCRTPTRPRGRGRVHGARRRPVDAGRAARRARRPPSSSRAGRATWSASGRRVAKGVQRAAGQRSEPAPAVESMTGPAGRTIDRWPVGPTKPYRRARWRPPRRSIPGPPSPAVSPRRRDPVPTGRVRRRRGEPDPRRGCRSPTPAAPAADDPVDRRPGRRSSRRLRHAQRRAALQGPEPHPRRERLAGARGVRSSSTPGSRCAASAGRSCCAARAYASRPRTRPRSSSCPGWSTASCRPSSATSTAPTC